MGSENLVEVYIFQQGSKTSAQPPYRRIKLIDYQYNGKHYLPTAVEHYPAYAVAATLENQEY
ncbi:hypothetical protein IC229_28695 [Spirosoma sp. BT702]|uniref:Uncharacterized protein n=1 Tax=Spirosoma profusum TaxID=2771354 RepID=A0A926Y235_9BACT|nr:hypothetical protein [Spirosoma profusum]MBD2704650.1 hypothetical protein [Spirosoma profusum]